MPRSVIITFTCLHSFNLHSDPWVGHSYHSHCTDRETETQSLVPCFWVRKLNSHALTCKQFFSSVSLPVNKSQAEGPRVNCWGSPPNHGQLPIVLCLDSQDPEAIYLLTITSVHPLWRALLSCIGELSLDWLLGVRGSGLIWVPDKPCGVGCWAGNIPP